MKRIAVLLVGALACHGPRLVASDLPGAPPLDGTLRDRLRAASDGHRFTNRLVLETSPYLRQHAHNPVDWRAWSDDAFAEARRLGRPVLLSIGYSTCHWCHVMERESFEDEAIARTINERYVAIKVDREERPDVDAVYLAAVERMTGGGGWPMTLWLTPDGRPFFGGTYFPPRRLVASLAEMSDKFARDRAAVERDAEALASDVAREVAPAVVVPPVDVPVDAAPLRAALAVYRNAFDEAHGGLRGAPKFPSSLPVRLLLRLARRTSDPTVLAMATTTLAHLAAGGIHDQIGGGFHRYSTDTEWRVPHFEKMLYDNARLAVAYVEAWQATGRADFADVARDTLDFMLRDLALPGGAFAAALDADAAGQEGVPYTWSTEDLSRVLGADEGARFGRYYDVRSATPSVLFVATPDAAEARALAPARAKLLAARRQRPQPARDDKAVAAWNGLAISAFAVAGRALGEPRYVEAARRAATFVTTKMSDQDGLHRSFAGGRATGAGTVDDYACVAAGLVDLYEATWDAAWLDRARALVDAALDRFADGSGGFWLTPPDARTPLARPRSTEDGPEPAGASVLTLDLLRLAELTGDGRYREAAGRALAAAAPDLRARPTAHAELLLAVDWATDAPREVVLVWPATDAGPPPSLLAPLATSFVPNRVLAGSPDGPARAALAKRVPLVDGKLALRGRATAYVCAAGRCREPTSDPSGLARELAETTPLP